MHLQGIDQSDDVMQQFVAKMASQQCMVNTRSNYSCWRLPFDTNWDDYVAGLSKSQRRNVRLVQRRILEADDVTIHQASDEKSLAYAMKWFETLHQKRWKSEGKPGCFSHPEFARFITQVAPRMFDRGSLRLLWIAKAGTPIAVDFSFLSATTSYGYQMGIDPDYRDQEIGRALLVAAMQATHQSGRTMFDFLRGDESYKSRWAAQPQQLLEIEIVPDCSLPLLRQNLFDFGRSVKRRVLGS